MNTYIHMHKLQLTYANIPHSFKSMMYRITLENIPGKASFNRSHMSILVKSTDPKSYPGILKLETRGFRNMDFS